MKIQDLLRKDVMLLDLQATEKKAVIEEMIQKYQEYRKLASALVTDVNTDEGITIEYVIDGQTKVVHFYCTNR